MAIITTAHHVGRQHPWGYEIPTTFVDDLGGEHNIVILFRKQETPSKVEINEATAMWIDRLETAVQEPDIVPEL